MNITIREELPQDRESIRLVNEKAFGQPVEEFWGAPSNPPGEADLVDALRERGLARLSLVAELEGQIVGHILFSAIEIVSPDRAVDALALAPMAVLPQYQRMGIGSRLIQNGLQRCREAGHRIAIVLGHPSYYPRFGFSPELASQLQSKYAGEAFMALELVPGALKDVAGEVRYSPPFEEF